MTGRARDRALPRPTRAWACFLDLDGTLVHFAHAPGAVKVDRQLRRLIRDLDRATGGAVALISGRPIDDLDRLFGDVPAAGLHGLERRDAAGRLVRHRLASRRLDEARRRFRDAARRHRGLLMEDKGMAIAIHYRRAPRLAGFVHRLARQVVAELGSAYCVQPGKRVVEIRPAGRHKGSAIRAFLREPPFRGRVPLFVGDDATDEAAFAAVNRLGGWSVKVGPGPTAARWRLGNVTAVRAWLRRIFVQPAPRRLAPRTARSD